MPTWFARRVLDLVGKLTDLYYRRKYGAMAQRLGRPGVSPGDDAGDMRVADGPGFILIQIDGLSHDHLMQAIGSGHMPHVSRLVATGRLAVAPWRCGLPSSTPAVQAGMMFGDRFDIPGYRWYEKDRGEIVTPQRLEQIRTVSDRISSGHRGILHGGSCYVSMFDGDADLALFTLTSLRRQRFFESIRGIGLLVLFLLSPLRVLRVVGLTLVNYLRNLSRRVTALLRPGVLSPRDTLSPLLHALSTALFTEVQTFGIMLDIYRCVPAIYTNYTGYDELAHKLGPDHPAAFRLLRGVDQRILQINRMRTLYRRRTYDLYLMSDHGNTPAVPFSRQSGRTLGEHILAEVGKGHSVDETVETDTHLRERARHLCEELQALEERGSPRFRGTLVATRRRVARRMRRGGALPYDLERKRDVIVSPSGSLAHVYFDVTERPLDLIEVMLVYPDLVDYLLKSPGIGAVMGRAEQRTIVLGRDGGTLDIGGEQGVVASPHPLAPYGEVAYTTDQVHRLAHFPHSGDLILLGEVLPDGTAVAFEEQIATHGGLGGPQGRPFIAWPPERPLTAEALNDAEDLYPYFMRHYQARGGGADRPAGGA
ncbi:MAG: alkaline phosphatase family protein [Anaerolineae bacterium]|jgi:hypothetical protein